MSTSFAKLYPPGHEFAGQVVTRTARCTCGALFIQTELNSDGIFVERPAARASYLESCSVLKDGRIYQPRHCPPCERRIANQQQLATR